MTRYHEECGGVVDYTIDEDGLSTLPRCMCDTALVEALDRYCGRREYDPLKLDYDVAMVTSMVEGGGQLCSDAEAREGILSYWEVDDPQTREAEIQAGQMDMFRRQVAGLPSLKYLIQKLIEAETVGDLRRVQEDAKKILGGTHDIQR